MIAVVVPTIRPDKYKDFLNKWRDYFDKPGIILVTVLDGDKPTVNGKTIKEAKGLKMNESYGEDKYFKRYKLKRDRWIKWIKSQ